MTGSADKRSFTSWKLELIDAMTCDEEMREIDRLVGVRIMQHASSKTGCANPSLRRIAAQLGKGYATVKRSAARLVEKHQWFERFRPTRTAEYVYRVNEEKALHVLDAKAQREDQARDALRVEKEEMFNRLRGLNREPSRGLKLDTPEGSNRDNHEGSPVSPEHLRENYLQEHLNTGREGDGFTLHGESKEGSPYAKATGGW